ncbi:class I SAM-dependent RNA methyltransferase [Treponema sp. Marseille-Q4130]|uniref:class I SAM-dependent RNA methyltransferase n=1 Tax=Treponema sp. Marseille-Q4130 TaxID=2766702 RepID=UPI001651DBD4|nr:TRAM domain-containing protein [Treponema sp. Marseille-Q4130]MBC6719535.1 class I SAM-dependent RNA methyltransferase [Treponema sp. Marseille-Q4130]
MPISVTAEKLAFGGASIARVNGKAVFIPYAIPGEMLDIEIISSKRDYDEAEIVSIIAPSSHRRIPLCPYYGICGGCNMMHIDDAYQRELRKSVLADCFLRAGIDVPEIDVVAGKSTGYRARFLLHDGGLVVRNGESIVPVTRCTVATDAVNAWLSETAFEKRPRGLLRIFGDERVVSANSNGKKIVSVQCAKSEESETVKTVQSARGKKIKTPPKRFSGTLASPDTAVKIALGRKEIGFDVRGFFQSNIDVLERAIEKVCDGLSGKNALDLYAGCGTFSVFLSDSFEHVTLVEHNRDALVFAEQNMAGKRHASFGVSGKTWVRNFAKTAPLFDAAVADPPRSGMEKETCDWLCKSGIPHIRSLSYDPATHARDAAKLVRSGYHLTSLSLLDFYPNTCHIESLAIFEKRAE